MIDRVALLADLKKQVVALEKDLLERASDQELPFHAPLHEEWKKARDASRTAATYESWLDGQVTQSAVAWVLGTVFLRFCEDNLLIELPYLAGPGERLALAKEREQEYFGRHENRHKTDREWITAGFEHMGDASPVAGGLFDRDHNPMWRITPSLEAAKKLIAFWRTTGADGEPVHDFTDPEWNTRFLGDLYQDLSEHARDTYALLQTPEFVEEFILDLTLTPAIKEFGLTPKAPSACPQENNLPHGLRIIDPTCGSGHFILGAFKRLFAAWNRQAPGADPWDLINRCLYSIHGVDKNPYAASIARFRLFIAAMRAGQVSNLAKAPEFTINIAIGDSLLHGRGAPGIQEDLLSITPEGGHEYSTEDVGKYIKSVDILGTGSYHAVVGNPPYITVSDRQENINYRAYSSCSGQYTLSIPFAERFFHLAIRGSQKGEDSGYVGQITSNSFMRQNFGKKLIEEYFPTVNLTHIIDTSGAYIPGHGTPTVILCGRRSWPTRAPIRVALSVRGEPEIPDEGNLGNVWRAILNQISGPASISDWIEVGDLDRRLFASHPWSLQGGGASRVKSLIDSAGSTKLSAKAEIGTSAVPREHEAFGVGDGTLRRARIPVKFRKILVGGEAIRDWEIKKDEVALWPYDAKTLRPAQDPAITKFLWPYKIPLARRTVFGKTQIERELPWTAYSMFFSRRFGGFSISFPVVSTHNHFSLDRNERVFKQSAPIIKLFKNATEDDYLGILGVLNSSTACFWLKQVSHDKGSQGVNEGFKSQEWERFYEFTGTKLKEFPLTERLPVNLSRQLDRLAGQRKETLPEISPFGDFAERIKSARSESFSLRTAMIALQEELDWEVYLSYGLIPSEEQKGLLFPAESLPQIRCGERAFEIVLARRVAAGKAETQWFQRHCATPVTDIPEHWPEEYKKVVRKRIDIIENRPDIALLERPEYKRRWASDPWDKQEKEALREWLLDRCEERRLWFSLNDRGNEQPRLMTVSRLADRMRGEKDFTSMAQLYSGGEANIEEVLKEIIEDNHVPYLSALRYKDTGIRKRLQWERTWELQREEAEAGEDLDIDMPPKYSSTDFQKPSYWKNRGKLDVPKERFISYPWASSDGDGSLLLGWAGWNHREQAQALHSLIEDRTIREGWDAARLKPLIAGLAEVMPWVKQWHSGIDPTFGQSPADAYATYLEDQKLRHGLTDEDLAAWRPEKKPTRGRKRKAE